MKEASKSSCPGVGADLRRGEHRLGSPTSLTPHHPLLGDQPMMPELIWGSPAAGRQVGRARDQVSLGLLLTLIWPQRTSPTVCANRHTCKARTGPIRAQASEPTPS